MATVAATRKPVRKQGTKLWVWVPLATAFAIIAGIAIYGVINPSKAKLNPNAPGYRGSLVWGDGIFANRAQLKAWLKLHGGSYEVWVKQHPAALRLVKPPHQARARGRAAEGCRSEARRGAQDVGTCAGCGRADGGHDDGQQLVAGPRDLARGDRRPAARRACGAAERRASAGSAFCDGRRA